MVVAFHSINSPFPRPLYISLALSHDKITSTVGHLGPIISANILVSNHCPLLQTSLLMNSRNPTAKILRKRNRSPWVLRAPALTCRRRQSPTTRIGSTPCGTFPYHRLLLFWEMAYLRRASTLPYNCGPIWLYNPQRNVHGKLICSPLVC